MLTKATAKLIQSLKDKRTRHELGLFVVEGPKTVSELLASKIIVKSLFATREWLEANAHIMPNSLECVEVSERQLEQLSFLQTPQQVLALVAIPKPSDLSHLLSGKVIALDTIQDPGNLGTIIRLADWYGITDIVCSEASADVYNPKVIQATMGSFMRVRLHYTNLKEWIGQQTVPVMGALMSGQNLHQTQLPQKGVLLIGNEGSGISPELIPFVTQAITIPRFGGAESLNAGVATAIICDAWLRTGN
jgi:TrmH family RNA methyltransferase